LLLCWNYEWVTRQKVGCASTIRKMSHSQPMTPGGEGAPYVSGVKNLTVWYTQANLWLLAIPAHSLLPKQ
jgi:hypothetical protein